MCAEAYSHKKTFKAAIEQREQDKNEIYKEECENCLLYTSPSPRDGLLSRMPSSA